MRAADCPHEPDVLDAVVSARWPDRLDAELTAHLATCAVCSETAIVAYALLAERDVAWRDAVVPPAGQVWWRAEMRARQEAIRAAAQPIAVAETAAGVLVLALLAVLGRGLWPWIREQGSLLHDFLAVPIQSIALGAIGLLAVVTPILLYLLVADE